MKISQWFKMDKCFEKIKRALCVMGAVMAVTTMPSPTSMGYQHNL